MQDLHAVLASLTMSYDTTTNESSQRNTKKAMLHLIIDRTVPLRNCTSWTRENAWNLVTGHSAYWSFLHKLILNMLMRLRTARKHHVKDSHDTRDSKTYLAPVGVVGTLITVCI